MRPTLASSLLTDKSGGFTLLELLVVLVIVSAVVGLVGAGVGGSMSRDLSRSAEEALQTAIHALPQEAADRGKSLRVDAAGLRARMGEWPDGWALSVAPALEYGPTGQAGGGRVSVMLPDGRALRWQVEPVTGRVSRLP